MTQPSSTPRLPPPPACLRTNTAQVPAVNALSKWSSKSRLLVAENDPDLRRFLCILLSSHYEVEAVANCELAWAAVQREIPALLVVDLHMPDLDGLGFIRRVRACSNLASLPIIALSADSGNELSLAVLAAGADDLLLKPFGCAELLVGLRAKLTRPKVGGDYKVPVGHAL